ncbi:MAG: ABC transporter substrate-binding protein [Thermoleophilia bacterium]
MDLPRGLTTRAAALLVAGTLVLGACGGGDKKEEASDKGGAAIAGGSADARTAPGSVESLRLTGGPWGYPQPFSYVRGPGLVYTELIFDTLLWKDSRGEPMGWLAKSWTRSDDGRTWTFKLRDGVKWHDGRPLTARDVAFTFDYFTKGAGSVSPGIVRGLPVSGVQARGDDTVVFSLPKPFAPFPETIAGRVPIIPEHIWADVKDPQKLRGPKAVTGSGPYRLKSYEASTGSYLFESNPAFFLGEPVVKRLELVPAKDELLALRREELSIASTGNEEALPEAAIEPFRRDPYGELNAPGEWNRALHFNLEKGFPYDEKRFRQAVAYAIDRQDLVKRVMLGRGDVGSTGGLAPSNRYATDGLPTYDHDLARAGRLLDELGLRDRDGDGMRDLPDGKPFSPVLLTSSFQSPKTAELVRQDLREAKLDVRLRSLDQAAADAATSAGRYTMALLGYGGLGGEPDNLRTRMGVQPPGGAAGKPAGGAAGGKGAGGAAAKGGGKGKGGGGGGDFTRVFGFTNPQFAALANKQLTAIDDQERRQALDEMQRIIAEEVPLLSLYVPRRTVFFREDTFAAWYYTPGGVFGGYPGPINKHVFVTGKKTGLPAS